MERNGTGSDPAGSVFMKMAEHNKCVICSSVNREGALVMAAVLSGMELMHHLGNCYEENKAKPVDSVNELLNTKVGKIYLKGTSLASHNVIRKGVSGQLV